MPSAAILSLPGALMKLTRLLPLLAITLAALLLLACGTAATPAPAATPTPAATATPTPTPEKAGRGEVLQSLTARVIRPGYAAAANATAALHQSAESLCAAPSPAALEAAQDAWRAARQAWLRTESYRFGPAMERRSASLVDWHPIDPDEIEALLAGGESITGERVREYLPATQRGLGAAEHLLFGPGRAALGDGGPGGEERCAYLTALTAVAQTETAGILADWQGDGANPGYAGFYDGTAASSLLDREAEAVAVRSLVFQVRAIANMRLAPALGLDGPADAAAIPSGAADNSRADLLSQLDGIAALYGGADGGLGLSDRVRALSEDTDARMRAAIESSAAAVENLDGSLIDRLATAPAEAQAVYDRLKEMQRILNTEIVSLLGVSVGFADTDGDS